MRLMRQLTAVGMFKEVEPAVYAHSPESYSLSTHPGKLSLSLRFFFEYWLVRYLSYIQVHLTPPKC